jgi:hypothetical protein
MLRVVLAGYARHQAFIGINLKQINALIVNFFEKYFGNSEICCNFTTDLQRLIIL